MILDIAVIELTTPSFKSVHEMSSFDLPKRKSAMFSSLSVAISCYIKQKGIKKFGKYSAVKLLSFAMTCNEPRN